MEIYAAICCDRHYDVDVEAFICRESAIEYAKEFIPDRYDIEENKLTDSMIGAGWIYWANYGVEGDSVRVEQKKLNI